VVKKVYVCTLADRRLLRVSTINTALELEVQDATLEVANSLDYVGDDGEQ
jgi:hypothetical protein